METLYKNDKVKLATGSQSYHIGIEDTDKNQVWLHMPNGAMIVNTAFDGSYNDITVWHDTEYTLKQYIRPIE